MATTLEREIEELPLTVDVPTAGAMFGLGRDASYWAVRRGDFPVPVIRVGRRLIVTRAALAAALGASA